MNKRDFTHKTLSGERGFTLVEILVVVIVIGILAGVAIPTFLSQRANAQDASAKSAARNALGAVVDHGVAEGNFLDETRGTGIAVNGHTSMNERQPVYRYEIDPDGIGPRVVGITTDGSDPSFVAYIGVSSESGRTFWIKRELTGNTEYAVSESTDRPPDPSFTDSWSNAEPAGGSGEGTPTEGEPGSEAPGDENPGEGEPSGGTPSGGTPSGGTPSGGETPGGEDPGDGGGSEDEAPGGESPGGDTGGEAPGAGGDENDGDGSGGDGSDDGDGSDVIAPTPDDPRDDPNEECKGKKGKSNDCRDRA